MSHFNTCLLSLSLAMIFAVAADGQQTGQTTVGLPSSYPIVIPAPKAQVNVNGVPVQGQPLSGRVPLQSTNPLSGRTQGPKMQGGPLSPRVGNMPQTGPVNTLGVQQQNQNNQNQNNGNATNNVTGVLVPSTGNGMMPGNPSQFGPYWTQPAPSQPLAPQ
jgi:hypothetical protein